MEQSFPLLDLTNIQETMRPPEINVFSPDDVPVILPEIKYLPAQDNIPIVSLTDEYGATYIEPNDNILYYQPLSLEQLQGNNSLLVPQINGEWSCGPWLLSTSMYSDPHQLMIHSDDGNIHNREESNTGEFGKRNKGYLRRGFSDDSAIKLRRQVSMHSESPKRRSLKSRQRRLGPRTVSEPNGHRKKVVKRQEYEVNQSLAHSDEADSDDSETKTLNKIPDIGLLRRCSTRSCEVYIPSSQSDETESSTAASPISNNSSKPSLLGVPSAPHLRRANSDSILADPISQPTTTGNHSLDIPDKDKRTKRHSSKRKKSKRRPNLLKQHAIDISPPPEDADLADPNPHHTAVMLNWNIDQDDKSELAMPILVNEYRLLSEVDDPPIVICDTGDKDGRRNSDDTLIISDAEVLQTELEGLETEFEGIPPEPNSVEELAALLKNPTCLPPEIISSRRRATNDINWSKMIMYRQDDPERMSFTRSLAFPPPPSSPLAKKRQRPADIQMESENQFNTYAKVVTLVVFVLVMSFIIGFLYKAMG